MGNNKHKLSYKHRVRGELKTKVLSYLMEHPCVICKEADPIVLEFDHLDPTDKDGSVARMVNDCKPWEVVEAEINKCRVLCANCHKRHTYAQLGFWKQL